MGDRLTPPTGGSGTAPPVGERLARLAAEDRAERNRLARDIILTAVSGRADIGDMTVDDGRDLVMAAFGLADQYVEHAKG